VFSKLVLRKTDIDKTPKLNSLGFIVSIKSDTLCFFLYKLVCNWLDNGLKYMARKHSNALLAKDHDFTNATSKFFEIDYMCKDTKKFCKHLGSLVAI